MLSQKMFENLHTAMAILVLFNNFEGKFVIFLAPKFECFTKYNAFCARNFNYAWLRRIRHIAYEEVRNHGKILFIPNIVENGWWGNAYAAYPTSLRYPPLVVY